MSSFTRMLAAREPAEGVRIVLPWGALASSNQRNKRRGGKAHADAYRASLDAIYLTAMAQLRQHGVRLPAFTEGDVAVSFYFYPPDRRRRDESNFLKALLDGLNGVAWRDDSQVVEWCGSRCATDPKKPRVEIELNRP